MDQERRELGVRGGCIWSASGVFTLYYFLQTYSSPPFSVRFNSKESAYRSALSSPSKGLQRRGHQDIYSLSTCLPCNRVLQAHSSAHHLLSAKPQKDSMVVTSQNSGCMSADPSTTDRLCCLWKVSLPPSASLSPSENVNNSNLPPKVVAGIKSVGQWSYTW